MARDSGSESSLRPTGSRLATALGLSAVAHLILVLLIVFDVVGIGGGFGLGIGPGFGIGAGGGAGLGEQKRREIFSLEDLPELVRPQEPDAEKDLNALLKPREAERVVVPQPVKPKVATTNAPVIQFARAAPGSAAVAAASAGRSAARSASTWAGSARAGSTSRSSSTRPAACRTSS